MTSTSLENFHDFVKNKINASTSKLEVAELMNQAYHQLVNLNEKIKSAENNEGREKLIESAAELATIAFMITQQ